MNDRCDAQAAERVVHFVVPDAIDDPRRPSGGNRYDRRVSDGLARSGWQVAEHAIPDAWPRLGPAGRIALAHLLPQLPDSAVVLVDGLIAVAGASVIVPAARRLSVVVLLHAAPEGGPAEGGVLAAARRVIVTSRWLRAEILRVHPVRADTIAVALPGVAPRPIAPGTPAGRRLLCLGAVAAHKGQDVLLAALARIAELQWHCCCFGSLEVDPSFVSRLHRVTHHAGLSDRVEFPGPRPAADLEPIFNSADVLVHPARAEGYGMVVTEALAHGMPVITTTAGGLLESVGTTPVGNRPGLLVPVDDAQALARALSRWLADANLRQRLRCAARARRDELPSWPTTVGQVASALRAAR